MDLVTCPNCGKSIKQTSHFCKYCGCKISTDIPSSNKTKTEELELELHKAEEQLRRKEEARKAEDLYHQELQQKLQEAREKQKKEEAHQKNVEQHRRQLEQELREAEELRHQAEMNRINEETQQRKLADDLHQVKSRHQQEEKSCEAAKQLRIEMESELRGAEENQRHEAELRRSEEQKCEEISEKFLIAEATHQKEKEAHIEAATEDADINYQKHSTKGQSSTANKPALNLTSKIIISVASTITVCLSIILCVMLFKKDPSEQMDVPNISIPSESTENATILGVDEATNVLPANETEHAEATTPLETQSDETEPATIAESEQPSVPDAEPQDVSSAIYYWGDAAKEIQSENGTFKITVKNIHQVDWTTWGIENGETKIVTLQAEIENVSYSGMYDNKISNYEICTEEGVKLLDSEGFALEFYDIAGPEDGKYEVSACTEIGSKKRVSLPFIVSSDCKSFYVQVGNQRTDLISLK